MQEMQQTQVRSLGQADPLEKDMATHSSILAWKIPWTEEPGRLQSMGSQRVRHNLVTEQGSVEFFRENSTNRGATLVSQHLAGAASHLGQL